MRCTRLILTAIATLAAIAGASAQSVGLVLSGGGAKGIAHIGVIKALEENDIPIDFVTGTSMGAIVGGLYASGYSPEEMMALLQSPGFANWSTGQIDENLVYYFNKPAPKPSLLSLNISVHDSIKVSSGILPKSLINPLPMNFAFMELFAPYTAQCDGDFNSLFVPFRCVGSDVYNKRKIVFSRGDLGDAIRASMSFPIVFKPIMINGIYAFDGGIYDNFPIDVMRSDFAPSIMIGVDVSSGESAIDKDNLIDQIEAMIMQPQDDSIPSAQGIKINVKLKEFGLLDFPKAQAIYKIGYDKAISLIDSIKGRIHRRVPASTVALRRQVFKSRTPELRFDSVKVEGGTPSQNAYIRGIFVKDEGDTITAEQAKIAYYRVISHGKIDDLLPKAKYNKENDMFSLGLQSSMKNKLTAAIGAYVSSSTSSMLYLSAAYRTLSFRSFDASISGWLGQSYLAGVVNAQFTPGTDTPSSIGLTGVMTRHKFYENDALFYDFDHPTFVLKQENFVKACYGLALGRRWKMDLTVGYGFLKDFFYPDNIVDFAKTQKDEAHYRLGQIEAKFSTNTLNSSNYPTSGFHFEASISGVYGDYKYMSQGIDYGTSYERCYWGQAELTGSKYWQISKMFVLGGKWDVVASTKGLQSNYTAMLVQAPAFTPTPSTENYFNTAFRANSFAAAGVLPIVKILDNLQLRTEFYYFTPIRMLSKGLGGKPEWDGWFSSNYMGEASLVFTFQNLSLSAYCNYLSNPSSNWNFGLNFGIYIPAPRFMR